MRRRTLAPVAALALLAAGCVVVDGRGGPPGPPAWTPPGRRVVVPPPVTVQPSLVIIAGTPLAFVENWPEDLFYFEGRYYRPHEGRWFWSVTLSGGWTEITVGQVPRVVVQVPADYRSRPGGPPPWAPAHGRRGKKG